MLEAENTVCFGGNVQLDPRHGTDRKVFLSNPPTSANDLRGSRRGRAANTQAAAPPNQPHHLNTSPPNASKPLGLKEFPGFSGVFSCALRASPPKARPPRTRTVPRGTGDFSV
jgi:hypothetical protein